MAQGYFRNPLAEPGLMGVSGGAGLGAAVAIVLGLMTWLLFLLTPAGEQFPAQLAGVLASLAGMLIGSLGPQAIRNRHAAHHKLAGLG